MNYSEVELVRRLEFTAPPVEQEGLEVVAEAERYLMATQPAWKKLGMVLGRAMVALGCTTYNGAAYESYARKD